MLFHSKWDGLSPSSAVLLFLFTGLNCQNGSQDVNDAQNITCQKVLSVFQLYVTIIFPSITMEVENGSFANGTSLRDSHVPFDSIAGGV